MGFEFLAQDLNKPPVTQEKKQEQDNKTNYKEIIDININKDGEQVISIEDNKKELKEKISNLKQELKEVKNIKDSQERKKRIDEISQQVSQIKKQLPASNHFEGEEEKVDASIVIEKEAPQEEQIKNINKSESLSNDNLTNILTKKDDSIVDNLNVDINNSDKKEFGNNELPDVDINTATFFETSELPKEENATLKFSEKKNDYNSTEETTKNVKSYYEDNAEQEFEEAPENVDALFSNTVSSVLDTLEEKGKISESERALADVIIELPGIKKIFLKDEMQRRISNGNIDEQELIKNTLYESLDENAREGLDFAYIKDLFENSGAGSAIIAALADWENVRKMKVNLNVDNVNISVDKDGDVALSYNYEKTWGNERERELEKVEELKEN